MSFLLLNLGRRKIHKQQMYICEAHCNCEVDKLEKAGNSRKFNRHQTSELFVPRDFPGCEFRVAY